MARCDSGMALSLTLTLVIAAASVGVAQFARQVERSEGCLGVHACAHFIVWLNGSSWMFLALPWCALRLATMSRPSRVDDVSTATSLPVQRESCENQVNFSWREVLVFFALAVGSNYAYIAALEFIPASLSTAVFSICPVLSLALSVRFLDATVPMPRAMWASAMISIVGVALISRPWAGVAANDTHDLRRGVHTDNTISDQRSMAMSRTLGCALSLVAAGGSACYQVYFKRQVVMAAQAALSNGSGSDGDNGSDDGNHSGQFAIGPVESGLFLSRLGLLVFVVLGATLGALIYTQTYDLKPGALPYPLLAATASLSLLFNFATTFGLNISSPMVVSLATQLGIPLNLAIDVLLDPPGSAKSMDSLAIGGVVLMLVSFTLSAGADQYHFAKPKSVSVDGNKVLQPPRLQQQVHEEKERQEKHRLLAR